MTSQKLILGWKTKTRPDQRVITVDLTENKTTIPPTTTQEGTKWKGISIFILLQKNELSISWNTDNVFSRGEKKNILSVESFH